MNVHLELLHGAENAFAILDARDEELSDQEYAAIARALDRDGLLVVLPSESADVRMRMFNPDGSEAEMCGNGIRCVARYLEEGGEGERFTIETLAGPIGAALISRVPYAVETQIGIPVVGEPRTLEAAGAQWRYVPVSLGNPHAVIFVDDPDAIDLEVVGRAIETHPDFPGGVNVHFARVVDRETLRVVHWERGAGATRACGTGIVACLAAAMEGADARPPVTVHVPGGTLTAIWDRRGDATLIGPVEHTGARDLILA